MAMQANAAYPNIFVVLIGFYGLFFLTAKLRNSAWGLVSTFALTGFMGYTLGPILNMYLGLANGGELISSALSMTALVFFGLSAYVLITRKDMSFPSGFITAGFFVLIGAMLRSEEHTSELQSLMRISYAVFCLKQKTTRKNITYLTT